MTFHEIREGLIQPLLQIVLFISVSLAVANFMEAMNWIQRISKLASPLIRAGRLTQTAGASLCFAFFSGIAANTLLAEAHEQGKLTTRDLVLANMLNTLPLMLQELPMLLMLTASFLGSAAFVYVGLTYLGSVLRFTVVLLISRIVNRSSRPIPVEVPSSEQTARPTRREVFENFKSRFVVRIKRILLATTPVYVAVFALIRLGFFEWLEQVLLKRVSWLEWLPPQAVSVLVIRFTGEYTAGLAAAGALLENGELTAKQVVLLMIIGSFVSAPILAIRSQLPYYTSIFKPRQAMLLIVCNNAARMAVLFLVGAGYFFLG